jgi:hypothetical protein
LEGLATAPPRGEGLVNAALLSLLLAASVQALEVTIEIDPVPLRAGQSLDLVVRVTGESRQRVEIKDLGLGEFTLLQTGGTSSSTQMSFGGGARSVSHNSVLRFRLRAPNQPGEHALGPVKVRAGNQTGQSAQVPVRVLGAGQTQQLSGRARGDLFIDFSVEPPQPYVGQQFTISSYVYSRVRLEGIADLDYPEAKGIWWEQLSNPSRAGSEVVVHAGRRFRRHKIGSIAGFAERSGPLLLSGGEAVVQVLQGDHLFAGLNNKTLSANPVAIEVLALPESISATQVGRYSVRHAYVPTQLNLGDVIELKVTVKGDGNIKSFALPELKAPPGLRAFSPKREVVMNEGTAQIGGVLTWTLPIQATLPGRHRIGGSLVRWFDPHSGKLRQAKVGPFEFEVIGKLAVLPEARPGAAAEPSQIRGPIGGFRSKRPSGSWLRHPLLALLLFFLVALAWWPRRESLAKPEEGTSLGALEEALEKVLGVPVRGLGRDELLRHAAAALGPQHSAELEGRLKALDAAAYGPSEQVAEGLKTELLHWLEQNR